MLSSSFLLMTSPVAFAGGLPFLQKRPDSWYESRAGEPVGARQHYYKGKYWPPYPRPTGEALPWIHRFHAALYWPYPYNLQDRSIVRQIAQQQVSNGWIVATTLYDYYFDPDTHQLTRAGRLHLRWILENASATHRVVFVQTAESDESSQTRLQSVKSNTVAMVGEGNAPPVMLRVTSPLGRPAEEIKQIRDAELMSQPKPRITDPIGSSSSEGTEVLSGG